MIIVGILAGTFIDFPAIQALVAGEKEESRLEQADADNFRDLISAKNRLTVINMMDDGNEGAENLRKIIEQLEAEQAYGARVAFAELDIREHKELATAQEVDFKDFSGQLDFYAAGYRLGSLYGPADRPEVEETIERYLEGLVKRFGPGWLPEVEGMQRAGKDDKILNVEPADPLVPGMQRTGGTDLVPGMQRTSGGTPPPPTPTDP